MSPVNVDERIRQLRLSLGMSVPALESEQKESSFPDGIYTLF
jgi:hypothetical protein